MRVVAVVSLAASAVLGLGALVVARAVMPHPASARPQVVAPVGRPVIVARQDIKYGQKLEPGLLVVAHAPPEAIPEGAFTSLAQVMAQDHGGAPVALVPIAAREPLLPAKLSGPGARASVAAEIADGMRAYAIKVTDVSGVGGHALPGDRVDVVMMRDLTPEGQARNLVSNVVLQNVRVLGIDLNADLSSNKPATPNTATLEVSVSDAQKLAVASTLGSLSLALRRSGQADLATVAVMDNRGLLGGAAPVVRHAAGPVRVATAERAPALIVVETAGSGKSPKKKAADPALSLKTLAEKPAQAAT